MIDHIRDKIDNPSTPDASGAATGDANKVWNTIKFNSTS